MSRTPFVAGNWKMHKTIAEAEEFITGLLPLAGAVGVVQMGVWGAVTAIPAVVHSTRGASIEV
jgi:triosephosphate isomerase